MEWLKKVFLFGVLFLALGTLYPRQLQAQCDAAFPCNSDADCQNPNGCPSCFVCNGTPGTCVPDDSICDDISGGNSQNVCRDAVCVNPPIDPFFNPTGCDFTDAALTGTGGLNDICYYCDPPQLSSVDTCGNGVCDSPGESCSSCPIDCTVPGWDQVTCPVNPNTVNPNICNSGITFPGPPYNTSGSQDCEDGDVCTASQCGPNNQCLAQVPLDCNEVSQDLCCPAGCVGPPPQFQSDPFACRVALDAGAITQQQFDQECDPDCWPSQICGDGFVQAPETCDGSIPTTDAGINVSKQQCRSPNSPNQCTYCGDGIIDSPSEECDGAASNNCGAEGCNTATCQCNTVPPIRVGCLEGSGNVTGGTGGPGCDGFACSLNRGARSSPMGKLLVLGALATILSLGWLARRRV